MQSTPFRVRHGIIVETSSNTSTAIVANNQVLAGSASNALVDLATTWNTTGNPTAIKLNVTNTASGASSALMDLQVGGNSRFYVAANGNVGIGNTTPAYKLEVAGSFAAQTKSFIINHPTKKGMKLRYGSLESPYHGVRLTGEAVIVENSTTIDLPDYIHALCKQEGTQVQITNIKHDKVIWVEEIDINNDTFTVTINRKKTDKKQYRFYWSFTAIRKDIEDMVVEFDDV